MSAVVVYIHADESCLGNQFQKRANPGGAGGLVEVWKDEAWERRDYWISEPDTTNNRMALGSAIEGLRVLKRRCIVHFVSDSQYLVKGVSEWMPNWKRAGWKRKSGKIENLQLWKRLDTLLQRHDMRPRWVKGHAGHPENEYANELATAAAKDRSNSGGLIDSGFQDWLDALREKGKYLDYMEFQAPKDRFREK